MSLVVVGHDRDPIAIKPNERTGDVDEIACAVGDGAWSTLDLMNGCGRGESFREIDHAVGRDVAKPPEFALDLASGVVPFAALAVDVLERRDPAVDAKQRHYQLAVGRHLGPMRLDSLAFQIGVIIRRQREVIPDFRNHLGDHLTLSSDLSVSDRSHFRHAFGVRDLLSRGHARPTLSSP